MPFVWDAVMDKGAADAASNHVLGLKASDHDGMTEAPAA
jgi:hypothetical protein